MKRFSLSGRKHNVLLQIEKVIFLTCILSDLVTVPGKDRSLRQLLRGMQLDVGAAAGCDLFRVTYS